jgi:hypothetical protein
MKLVTLDTASDKSHKFTVMVTVTVTDDLFRMARVTDTQVFKGKSH